jgi:hypothetical protein
MVVDQKPDQGGQRGAEGKEMDIDDDLPYPDFASEVSKRSLARTHACTHWR